MNFLLATGQVAFIDDEDADIVSNYKWRIKDNDTNHIRRSTSFMVDGKKVQKTIYLHRALLEKYQTCLEGKMVDHINRNPLDCTKSNLRIASAKENSFNASIRVDNSTTFKGVHKTKDGSYQAQIRHNGVKVCLGTYAKAEDAAQAYNKAAKNIQKDFAVLNIVGDSELVDKREAKKTLEGRLYGVYKSGNKFRARITVNGKKIDLGSYDSQTEAARVYDNYLTNQSLNGSHYRKNFT